MAARKKKRELSEKAQKRIRREICMWGLRLLQPS